MESTNIWYYRSFQPNVSNCDFTNESSSWAQFFELPNFWSFIRFLSYTVLNPVYKLNGKNEGKRVQDLDFKSFKDLAVYTKLWKLSTFGICQKSDTSTRLYSISAFLLLITAITWIHRKTHSSMRCERKKMKQASFFRQNKETKKWSAFQSEFWAKN